MAAFVLDSPYAGETFAPPTPLDIATIEAAIVGQLRNAVGNVVDVAHFPDKPEAYRMTHRVGAVLVIFAGSEYEQILATDLVVQERKLAFDLDVAIRDLGWAYGGPASGPSPGAYQLLEAIRLALTGFQPNTGCRKMWASAERFVERDVQGGVFYYRMTFHTTTRVVENYQAPNFPLFVTGVFQEEARQTARAVAAAPYTFNGAGEIQLPYGNISAVTVSARGGAVYTVGVDYSVDSVGGTITRIATGAIAAGATVDVAYAYADVVTTIASGGSAPTAPTN